MHLRPRWLPFSVGLVGGVPGGEVAGGAFEADLGGVELAAGLVEAVLEEVVGTDGEDAGALFHQSPGGFALAGHGSAERLVVDTLELGRERGPVRLA